MPQYVRIGQGFQRKTKNVSDGLPTGCQQFADAKPLDKDCEMCLADDRRQSHYGKERKKAYKEREKRGRYTRGGKRTDGRTDEDGEYAARGGSQLKPTTDTDILRHTAKDEGRRGMADGQYSGGKHRPPVKWGRPRCPRGKQPHHSHHRLFADSVAETGTDGTFPRRGRPKAKTIGTEFSPPPFHPNAQRHGEPPAHSPDAREGVQERFAGPPW